MYVHVYQIYKCKYIYVYTCKYIYTYIYTRYPAAHGNAATHCSILNAMQYTATHEWCCDMKCEKVTRILSIFLQAEAARELLEICAEKVQVDASEVGYIIGKGGEQIRDLQVYYTLYVCLCTCIYVCNFIVYVSIHVIYM